MVLYTLQRFIVKALPCLLLYHSVSFWMNNLILVSIHLVIVLQSSVWSLHRFKACTKCMIQKIPSLWFPHECIYLNCAPLESTGVMPRERDCYRQPDLCGWRIGYQSGLHKTALSKGISPPSQTHTHPIPPPKIGLQQLIVWVWELKVDRGWLGYLVSFHFLKRSFFQV